jgi:hypothetical protein
MAESQVLVKGPSCVTTGVSYQYDITGPWQANSSFQFCVTGGVIVDNGTTCYSGNPVSFVRVNWNEQATSGHIAITTDSGNAALDVAITAALDAGQIDSSSRFQRLDSNQVPSIINCSLPAGGNCLPTYTFQWQQSYDLANWTDVDGANGQNLSFTSATNQTLYYRRKVTENGSGAVGYSQESAIMINY